MSADWLAKQPHPPYKAGTTRPTGNMAQSGSYLIASADLVESNVSELTLDPVVHLHGLRLYQQRCDNACSHSYPFFLIELANGNKLVRYDVYKYIAQLPYYVAVRRHGKLPTIDHINRMPSNCCMSNMRYCTSAQNAQNMCRQRRSTAQYHGVCANGQIMVFSNGTHSHLLAKANLWRNMLVEVRCGLPPPSQNASWLSERVKMHAMA